MMKKFEELTKERQERIIETNRDINVDFDWYKYSLDDIAEQIKEKVDIDLKGVDLMFEFFRKGNSGMWTSRADLFSAFIDKYPNLEDLNISEEFGVWAYIGLRRDDIEDVSFEEDDEDIEDLTKLLKDKEDEDDNAKVKVDLEVVLDIFTDGYNSLYEEYGNLTSDESIVETIKLNELEFDDE